MATSGVNVYVMQQDGKTLRCVGRNVNSVKLVMLSPKAAVLLRNGGASHPSIKASNNIMLFAPEADTDAAIKICRWIEKYDTSKAPEDQGLKLKDIDPNNSDYTFPDLVMLYSTAYAFMIPSLYRGNKLRNAIYEYIHMGALQLDEFIMVHECLPFDGGMLKTAQHHCMWLKVMGPIPPEQDGIEAWAKEVGVWEIMEAAEENIRERKTRQDAAATKYGRALANKHNAAAP